MTKITVFGQEIEVETDLELPPRTRSNPKLDGLADLPVGGGIFYECDAEEAKRTRSRLRVVERRHGGEYDYRVVEEGVMIKRIA